MTDQNHLELWRRWEASRSLQDQVALLVEGMRLGQVAASTVRLAAFLGEEAAAEAISEVPPSAALSLYRWLKELFHEIERPTDVVEFVCGFVEAMSDYGIDESVAGLLGAGAEILADSELMATDSGKQRVVQIADLILSYGKLCDPNAPEALVSRVFGEIGLWIVEGCQAGRLKETLEELSKSTLACTLDFGELRPRLEAALSTRFRRNILAALRAAPPKGPIGQPRQS